MADSGNSLFDYNGSPIMPDMQERISETGLMGGDVEKAIRGEVVKKVIIPEDTLIFQPNYVIDFSTVDTLYEFQMEALDSFISSDGDVALYAFTKGGLTKLGTGISDLLDRVLTISVAKIFNGKCPIYKDFQIGKPLKQVSDKDITSMRIGL